MSWKDILKIDDDWMDAPGILESDGSQIHEEEYPYYIKHDGVFRVRTGHRQDENLSARYAIYSKIVWKKEEGYDHQSWDREDKIKLTVEEAQALDATEEWEKIRDTKNLFQIGPSQGGIEEDID